MNKKLLKLQERTIIQIQHASMRLAELNNILTVINLYLDSEYKFPKVDKAIASLERRIEMLERRPAYAGQHEHHKV